MYEDKTIENLHKEMLSDINDKYEKIDGSFAYDITKATAIRHKKIYDELKDTKAKMSIENLEGNELEQAVKERTGITRKKATKATNYLIVFGNGVVNIGELFETETGIQYQAIEYKHIQGSGEVKIECILAGKTGNVPANQIIKMPVTIEGITGCTNDKAFENGYEAETDKSLLERYYERIQTPATSGNKAHFRNWAKDVAGVGDAKVFSLWNGDNTVKVSIIDADKKPAAPELVLEVQNYIDPGITGKGDGVAPIGAFCTIESALGKTINIKFTPTKDPAFSDSEIIQNIEANITKYFQDIAFNEVEVSYAHVGAIIFSTQGIKDYSNLKINDTIENILIANNEVAVLGGVVFV